jgi:predicted O-linked N-acetylglucosamine transferase (SPINDLY family)
VDDEDGLAAMLAGARASLDPPGASDPILAARSLGIGVPVITLPGDLPRSRGALCCYERMGLNDYVADSDASYVDAAVALGTAAASAAEATQLRIADAANVMFDNDEAILALGEALEDVVRKSA